MFSSIKATAVTCEMQYISAVWVFGFKTIFVTLFSSSSTRIPRNIIYVFVTYGFRQQDKNQQVMIPVPCGTFHYGFNTYCKPEIDMVP